MDFRITLARLSSSRRRISRSSSNSSSNSSSSGSGSGSNSNSSRSRSRSGTSSIYEFRSGRRKKAAAQRQRGGSSNTSELQQGSQWQFCADSDDQTGRTSLHSSSGITYRNNGLEALSPVGWFAFCSWPCACCTSLPRLRLMHSNYRLHARQWSEHKSRKGRILYRNAVSCLYRAEMCAGYHDLEHTETLNSHSGGSDPKP